MKDQWRLQYHLMPVTGWLNDPNGLCQFQGEYHFFFQYSPDNPLGGRKTWGHYRSKDLLNWEFLGAPLKPVEPYESHGIYSGSAIVVDDVMHLYYTGNVKLKGDYNYITNGRQGNSVHIKSKDGVHFEEKQCVLTNADYPDNLTCHVRDPKVVSGESIGETDALYYMALGARTNEDMGEVLLYQSDDLTGWTLANVITSQEKLGFMWECPDLFMVGDKKILSVSPQSAKQEGMDYTNVYQSGYFELKGSFVGDYQLGAFRKWDRGFDFYAPQTFEDEQGRRILVGWMGMPSCMEYHNPTVDYGWQHALTIPRELSVVDGKLVQQPVAELKDLRREQVILPEGEVSADMEAYEVLADNPLDADMEICISEGLWIRYKKNEGMVTFTFTNELGSGRTERAVAVDCCYRIHILVDTSGVEAFLNNGEETFTTRFYPEDGRSSVCIKATSGRTVIWQLTPMCMDYEGIEDRVK